ncbi:MAG: RND family transporter [Coriobacteriia bacterium]
MDRVAGFIVANSKRIIGAIVLLTLVAAAMLFRMSFNADITDAIMNGSDVGRQFAALNDKYSTGDPVNILVTATDGTFTEGKNLVALRELRLELESLEGVAEVATIIPDDDTLLQMLGVMQQRMAQMGAAAGQPVPQEMVGAQPPPLSEEDIPEALESLPSIAVRQGLLANPMADLLVTDDGKQTLVMVVPEQSDLDSVRRIMDWAEGDIPGGFELTVSGNPVVWVSVYDMLSWFLLAIPPVIIGLLLLIFFASIGDRRLTIIAIVPAIMGSIWTFGLIFGLGLKVDIVTILVPIFVIVMGSADGLHFVTHYQEESARTDDKVERVKTTLRQIGVPMILTSVSTAAGFLSLLVADVRPIRELGLFAAIGITFAGIISFFFLPALLSRLDVSYRPHRSLIGPRVVRAFRQAAPRRWIAALVVAACMIFSALFVPRLEVNSDQLFMFKPDHPIRQDFAAIEEALGGATPLVGEFAYDPDADPEAERARILAVEEEMRRLPAVRDVFSVADLADSLAQEAPEEAQALMRGEVLTPMGQMVSEDGMRFVLFPGDFETSDLREWVEFAEQSDDVKVLTGMPVVWDQIARLVIDAQTRSLAVAFGLVALMLAVAYRRVRETVVSLFTLALTVGVLLGFIAASGIQLNLVTAIISAIVLGVAIDYAIHFVAAIDHARADGPGYVLRAIDKAGRPILANALGIAIGLTGLWLSPFNIHGYISMIMWVSMTTAAVTTLLVVSALSPRDGLVEA